MAERPTFDLKTQAITALREGDRQRPISETRTLESGKTVRIYGLAEDYHPRENPGTVGAIDPQTGKARYNF